MLDDLIEGVECSNDLIFDSSLIYLSLNLFFFHIVMRPTFLFRVAMMNITEAAVGF